LRILIIGNSNGIGLALTERLLGRGFVVTGISRSSSRLAGSVGYSHVIGDVAAHDYARQLGDILAVHGPFDACIYCAGIGELLRLPELSQEANVFRVNLVGAIETIAAVMPSMINAKRGHLIALSSIGDDAISADAPSYSASKAGLSSYLAGMALAVRPHGVAVSNIRLGFVDTKMAKAPNRPMMMSAARAATIVEECLVTRRARVTVPWRMSLIVRLHRAWALLTLRLGRR
jgi:short-subunit dehydrogenase